MKLSGNGEIVGDDMKVERLPEREDGRMIPRGVGDGLVEVDATWGSVQPIELAGGVRTVGELEVIEHLGQGLPLIDTRLREYFDQATIPGARWIQHDRILDQPDQLDRTAPTVFFCNGPQCTATPDAIGALLDAGYPGSGILYYRGGIHDWMTLGYPVVPGEASDSEQAASQRA